MRVREWLHVHKWEFLRTYRQFGLYGGTGEIFHCTQCGAHKYKDSK